MEEKSESLGKVVSKRKASVESAEKENLASDNLTKVEELSKLVEELRKELDSIKAQSKSGVSISPQEVKSPNLTSNIQPNEYIKVMSLVDNKLNLSTKGHGEGKIYTFEEFGEIQDILYMDLVEINNEHRNFLQAGYYYILDDRVAALAYKPETYKRILRKEEIEMILNNDSEAIDLFQSANPKQQNVIIDLIIKKIVGKEEIDYNIVDKISRVSGVNILEKAKARIEAKEVLLAEANGNQS